MWYTYFFQPGSYPTFLYISFVSQDGVRTINVIFTALSWELVRPVPRVRPTCSTTYESVTTPDWRWRFNEFTSVLDYLRPHQMSEAEERERRAKTARAKALVRTLPNRLKSPLFLTITDPNSSRRGNRPQSQTRVLRHRGRSPRCRKTSLPQIHPRPKPVKPRTRRTCKSHLFRNSATEAYSHLTRVPKI